MATLNESLRSVIATRVSTDYTTGQSGSLALKFPNQPIPQNTGAGYIDLSWRKGVAGGSSFFARRESVPFVLFAMIFVGRDSGTRTANQEADKLSDAIRGQTWRIISAAPSGVVPGRQLDGANPITSIVSSVLRLHDPVTDDIGDRANDGWYQINLVTNGELVTKYGLTA